MARKRRRTYPNLASYMKAERKTQAEVAALLGRSQPFISKIRRGLQEPSLREGLRISEKLGIPPESLLAPTVDIPQEKS